MLLPERSNGAESRDTPPFSEEQLWQTATDREREMGRDSTTEQVERERARETAGVILTLVCVQQEVISFLLLLLLVVCPAVLL